MGASLSEDSIGEKLTVTKYSCLSVYAIQTYLSMAKIVE